MRQEVGAHCIRDLAAGFNFNTRSLYMSNNFVANFLLNYFTFLKVLLCHPILLVSVDVNLPWSQEGS